MDSMMYPSVRRGPVRSDSILMMLITSNILGNIHRSDAT